MGPKKGVKMDLSTFLNDESLGGSSWADDDDIDFNAVGDIPKANASSIGGGFTGANPLDPAFGGNLGGAGGRGNREEFPIPENPPFRARINNLPWDINEDDVKSWFNQSLQSDSAVQFVSLPKDRNEPTRLAGFGFITFDTQDQLKQSLTLSATEFNGRRIFVNVAAPDRNAGRPRREEVQVDWGAARSGPLPPREDSGRGNGERRPRREEPNVDWGAARGPLPPREDSGRGNGERRPRREEPNVDWSAPRSGPLPPREEGDRPQRSERRPKKEEPSFDWGAARSGPLPPREENDRPQRSERSERKPKKEEPVFDWGSARSGAPLPPRERSSRNNSNKTFDSENWVRGQQPSSKPQSQQQTQQESAKSVASKSAFSVLSNDDDEE